jgi:hypothetical protein
VATGEGTLHPAEQAAHLTVDDDRVQPLLAAEVLVHDGLGHPRLGGDLLDRGRLEALLGEQLAADLDQLLASRGTGHARAASLLHGFGHAGQATRARGRARGRGHYAERAFPGRLMAGRRFLVALIGVRILSRELSGRHPAG